MEEVTNMTKRKPLKLASLATLMIVLFIGCLYQKSTALAINPYLPEWEHIPDGEPYVFEDPEHPGKERIYIYGSHDTSKTSYCGPDLTVWSAPVEDLTDWRCDGVIFEYSSGTKKDTMYAPDVAVVNESDGSKTYYLYPNDQTTKRNSMVCKSKSPIGPFEPINLNSDTDPSSTGVMGFDPAVFVDDDGRVYGYWGFHKASMAELDPATMATVKPGTSIIDDAFLDYEDDDQIRFFEASSMRKINDKYIFIYSRKTQDGEFGLGKSTATLAYLYSDNPLGPWTYGGTIIDARGRNTDSEGNTFAALAATNTHGSLAQVNGQWYIFYHRSINNDGGYSRQGMAEPVDITFTEDGKVKISEAEVTSEGMEMNGLDPFKLYSAGISCYTTGGSYIQATWDKNDIGGAVSNNKNGAIVGYKYFNFTNFCEGKKDCLNLRINYTGTGNDGIIKVRLDSPYTDGKDLGTISVEKSDSQIAPVTKILSIDPEKIEPGKHALYFLFETSSESSLCILNSFQFSTEPIPPTVSPSASPEPTVAPTATPTPSTPTPILETSQPAPAVYNLDKVKLKTIKIKKGKAVIKWKSIKNASRYEIQYSSSRKFKKLQKKTTKKTSIVVKKLKKKKLYYIRVRAYSTINGKKVYGTFSSIRKIKTR